MIVKLWLLLKAGQQSPVMIGEVDVAEPLPEIIEWHGHHFIRDSCYPSYFEGRHKLISDNEIVIKN